MSVSQTGVTTNATAANATSVVVDNPGSVVAGDVLLAYFTCNNQDCTPPSGFVQIADATSEIFRLQIFYKIATGSEPSTYTFSVPAAAPLVATMNAWRNVDNSDVLDIDAQTETALTHSEPYTLPTLSGAGATAGRIMQVRACRIASSTPVDLTTTDSGYDRRANVGIFSGGSVSYSHGVFSQNSPGYSDTSNKAGIPITSSGSEAHNVVANFALKESAVTGSFVATLPGVEADMDGFWSEPAELDAELPLPSVSITGLGQPPSGTFDVAVPVTVGVNGFVIPTGSVDVLVLPVVDLLGETRYFAENVVSVEREDRWIVVTQDGYYLGTREAIRDFSVVIDLPLLSVAFTGTTIPLANAPAQLASASVGAFGPSVKTTFAAGQSSPSVQAFGATISHASSAQASAGAVSVTVQANSGSDKVKASAGEVSVTCHN